MFWTHECVGSRVLNAGFVLFEAYEKKPSFLLSGPVQEFDSLILNATVVPSERKKGNMSQRIVFQRIF